jgi:hypothetical protein
MADTRNINEALDSYTMTAITNLNGNAGENVTSLTQANSSFKQRYDDTYYLVYALGGAYSMNVGGLGNQTADYQFSDFYNVNTTLAGNSAWGGAYYSSGPMSIGDTAT